MISETKAIKKRLVRIAHALPVRASHVEVLCFGFTKSSVLGDSLFLNVCIRLMLISDSKESLEKPTSGTV